MHYGQAEELALHFGTGNCMKKAIINPLILADGCLTFYLIFLFFTACDIRSDTKPVGRIFFDDFSGTTINETVWQIATWTEHGGKTGREQCYVQDGLLHLVFINSSADGFLSAAILLK
jgi:hypothetical protein